VLTDGRTVNAYDVSLSYAEPVPDAGGGRTMLGAAALEQDVGPFENDAIEIGQSAGLAIANYNAPTGAFGSFVNHWLNDTFDNTDFAVLDQHSPLDTPHAYLFDVFVEDPSII
jgi:hypothetical protein